MPILKFLASSISQIRQGPQNLKSVMYPDHAPFGDNLSYLYWHLPGLFFSKFEVHSFTSSKDRTGASKFKSLKGHVTLTLSLLGVVCHL